MNKNTTNSYFSGLYLKTTMKRIMTILGPSEKVDGTITNEWVIEKENEQIITIYDWQENRKFSENEVIIWHIGKKNITNDEIITLLVDEVGFEKFEIIDGNNINKE